MDRNCPTPSPICFMIERLETDVSSVRLIRLVTIAHPVICRFGGSPAKDLTGFSRHLQHDPTRGVAGSPEGSCRGAYLKVFFAESRNEGSTSSLFVQDQPSHLLICGI